MNKQIEALKMAIYSFEKLMVFDDLRAEIQICKEALAEAEKSDKEIVSEFWNNFKEL